VEDEGVDGGVEEEGVFRAREPINILINTNIPNPISSTLATLRRGALAPQCGQNAALLLTCLWHSLHSISAIALAKLSNHLEYVELNLLRESHAYFFAFNSSGSVLQDQCLFLSLSKPDVRQYGDVEPSEEHPKESGANVGHPIPDT
jgi:hypothetical protein